MATKWGKQPAYYILHLRDFTIRGAARAIDVPAVHLYQTLYGRIRPCPEVRERLPELLNLPLEDLFNADLLVKAYDGSKDPYKRGR